MGIWARKHANAEAKEFLKSTACVNFCGRSIFVVVKGLSPFCSSQSSQKLFGDRIFLTTGFARKVMLVSLKYSRSARKAGVQRTASPIGDGSQTKILGV